MTSFGTNQKPLLRRVRSVHQHELSFESADREWTRGDFFPGKLLEILERESEIFVLFFGPYSDFSRPHSELKFSMSIRPATHSLKSGSDSGPPSIQNSTPASVVVVAPPVAAASSGAAGVAAGAAGGPAPGTPPHDSLGYFSEPEIAVAFDCSVSDISEV